MTSPAITVRYGDSDADSPPDIIAGTTVLFFATTDLPANTLTGYDNTKYPASPAVNYYFEATLAGQDAARSQVAGPDGGSIEWNDWIPPVAGAWTVAVRDVSDDSQVATTTVTAV